jgi:hypothetical protein
MYIQRRPKQTPLVRMPPSKSSKLRSGFDTVLLSIACCWDKREPFCTHSHTHTQNFNSYGVRIFVQCVCVRVWYGAVCDSLCVSVGVWVCVCLCGDGCGHANRLVNGVTFPFISFGRLSVCHNCFACKHGGVRYIG